MSSAFVALLYGLVNSVCLSASVVRSVAPLKMRPLLSVSSR